MSKEMIKVGSVICDFDDYKQALIKSINKTNTLEEILSLIPRDDEFPKWFLDAIRSGWKCDFVIDNFETYNKDFFDKLKRSFNNFSSLSFKIIASNLACVNGVKKNDV